MTTNDIDAIRKLTDAATDAPWNAHTTHPTVVWQGSQYDEDPGMISTTLAHAAVADADFIAAARTLVPALCDEIEQLRATVNVRKGQLRSAREHAADLADELEKVRGQYADTRRHADRAQDEPSPVRAAREQLDRALRDALPLAGGQVRGLLKALRRELERVDAKRAEQAEATS